MTRQQRVLAAHITHIQSAPQGGQEMFLFDRLDHVVEGSRAHALDGHIDLVDAGGDNHRQFRVALHDDRQHIPARHARHVEIQDHGIELMLFHEAGHIGPIVAGNHIRDTVRAQGKDVAAQQVFIVVNQEDGVNGKRGFTHAWGPRVT